MHIVEDLDGVNIVRALVQLGVCEITLLAPKFAIDGATFPAESFRLDQVDSIRALHNVLTRMLEAVEELNNEEVLE